ncbi:Penicillinase repressor [Allorhodopirellula heiligendammensis]|uniref:Penicillinase repressor n=2 Tax=Allorhodopirellula heiligendammensis TaxID=2714739 RepID=A0A5C6BFH4_9BACT|nr:Penicillinase repressor [Allorhodopirellula heiligendammensis]
MSHNGCDVVSPCSPFDGLFMAIKPADVTDAELAVLQVLWNGSATIREITDLIYPEGSPSHYATVKKLLSRIESKGLVKRDSSQIAHRFTAAISQDDLIARRLQHVAEDICDGSHTPLLINLLKNRKYSAQERRELHELFDELFGNRTKK